MSRQLSLAAFASVLASALFALAYGPQLPGENETGAAGIPATPAFEAALPDMPAAPSLFQ